jgi:chemotaxis protein methyltransferase CheR
MAFTYFFRDMQTLETIRDYALPELKKQKYINIWDAGCAMGPEPYSLAIVLRESMGPELYKNVRIHGSDIDRSNLFTDIITKAEYPGEQIRRIPKDILARYFNEIGSTDVFKINEEIRNSLQFQRHDLLSLQPIRKDFGLIMCKNVLLHFQQKERIEVIKMFHSALLPGGFFATEQTQKMPPELSHKFEQIKSNVQLFRKI